MRAKPAAVTFGVLVTVGTGVAVTGGVANAAPYVPCPTTRVTSTAAAPTRGDLPPWLQDCAPQPNTGLRQPATDIPQPNTGLRQPATDIPQPNTGLQQPGIDVPQPGIYRPHHRHC